MHVQRFKINQLRMENLVLATEAIAFLILAFFVTVYLPTILYQFVYADQQLTAEPELIQYIPVASFVTAIAFFIYALVANTRRMLMIWKLEKEMAADEIMDGCNCGHDHHHHMMEMEVMEEKPAKTKTLKKKSTK